jgi:hypothetical protein
LNYSTKKEKENMIERGKEPGTRRGILGILASPELGRRQEHAGEAAAAGLPKYRQINVNLDIYKIHWTYLLFVHK